MATRRIMTIDGNETVASVAHRLNEVIVIYPITPSSTMGEDAEERTVRGERNIWGSVPEVIEMQSEGGAVASVHGVLQSGVLSTTFTASQGLLLMIPNMYKIAGELTPFCMHVSARTVAAHALSIFGDHSDVMACRQTDFAMLASGSVQEAHDLACIGTAVSLRTRVPMLHFFDGFRTSHEVAKIEELTDDDLRHMLDDKLIAEHRLRALTPDRPVLRGTAQNPDVFFQCREAGNRYYDACATIVQQTMDQFAELTGRSYHPFDYVGDPQAERVIVLMGSGTQTVDQTVQRLGERDGEKLGVLKVRLYRPFSIQDFAAALPPTVKALAVLDRTKEPGATGEPLYLDVVTAIHEAQDQGILPMATSPRIIGGRYGLSSKEFTPAMVKAVFDELSKAKPKNHFTIGINDDVTGTSLDVDESFHIESDDIVKAMFFGLGSDGTVGANKNSIKIIGEETDNFAQGYFVYDSKKAGAMTISHLRFGPRPIRSQYLITKANFVACHHAAFLEKFDMLGYVMPGGVFLLNSLYAPGEVWAHLPRQMQQQFIDKGIKFYVIDAYKVAADAGMGRRINTVMQTCFFAISGVLPKDEAIAQIKKAIEKTYSKKGAEIVSRNWEAVDRSLEHLHQVTVPDTAADGHELAPTVPDAAPDFVKHVSATIMAGHGDSLPVSAFSVDGTWPTATAQWEKNNIALTIPIWDAELCIQCNKCALVCPHAAIRAKVYDPTCLDEAPATFLAVDYTAKNFRGQKYTLQVAPEDCTGCMMCVDVCPAKNKTEEGRKAINMEPHIDHVQRERVNFDFFLDLPEVDRTLVKRLDVKGSQFFLPLFEFSGACAGCGETPYIKLMTQLFGDRTMIANATGCSSIYGGNLPTTPYTTNADGRGPTWSNSLFEDNAEFGFGFRLGVANHQRQAHELLKQLSPQLGDELIDALIGAEQHGEEAVAAQRLRVEVLKTKLKAIDDPLARRLELLADYLVRKSVWTVGGDGWAYDIGYGGLDHVLAMNHDVNVLVLDTEVYSNTGGQASKATPMGASAKYAAAGKSVHKKDLGLMAMSYGHIYVASIAMGANDNHTVKAFVEADSYDGPSLIIAYSHCIAHGYDMSVGLQHQKMAVNSGSWPLYRFDPRRIALGKPPLQVEKVRKPVPAAEYRSSETRFRLVEKVNPEFYAQLADRIDTRNAQRAVLYEQIASLSFSDNGSS
jgi:pyruvate-ferredoxin/flavodoxin oxidoreductase